MTHAEGGARSATAPRSRDDAPVALPGLLLGIGMGGFVEGVVNHHLLELHRVRGFLGSAQGQPRVERRWHDRRWDDRRWEDPWTTDPPPSQPRSATTRRAG